MRAHSWQDNLRHRLLDYTLCPDCATKLTGTSCGQCGLRLDGSDGVQIANAGKALAAALEQHDNAVRDVRIRQKLPMSLGPQGAPSHMAYAGPPVPSQAHYGQPAGGVKPPYVATPRQSSPTASWDLAVVFALAGVGLFAVAALVFAFFLVDDNPLLRAAVMVLVTGLSAVGTRLLLRRGLQESAQAVAWLTAGLAAVDCWVIALLVHGHARMAVAAVCLLMVVVTGVAGGSRMKLQAWTSVVVLLPLVPVLLGGATSTPAGAAAGLAAAALVTLVRRPFATRIAPAMGITVQIESALFVAWAIYALLMLPNTVAEVLCAEPVTTVYSVTWPLKALGWALGLAITAALAFIQGRAEQPMLWSGAAGFLLVSAGAAAAMIDPAWALPQLIPQVSARMLRIAYLIPGGSLLPVGALVIWLVLARLPQRLRTDPRHRAVIAGGGIAALISCMAVGESIISLSVLVQDVSFVAILDRLPEHAFSTNYDGPWRALIAAGCLLVLALMVRRLPLPDREVQVCAQNSVGNPMLPRQVRTEVRPAVDRQFGQVLAPIAAVIGAGMLPVLLRQWTAALLIAALVLAVVLVEMVRHKARDRFWWPVLLVGALGQLLLVATLSWICRPTLVIGGVLLPLLLLRLRRVTTPSLRWLHTVAVVGYPAIVLPVALSWLGWSAPTIAGVVALVLLALAVTLTWTTVDTGSWIAALVVAGVPSAVACTWTFAERNWPAAWTSAALAMVAGVFLSSRARPIPDALRQMAAAVLLPTVGFALINAGSMLLPGSGAPVLLPVIAALSAAVAIAASVVETQMVARGGPSSRAALEWSALLTGTLTLFVALARPGVGADTVLAVCAILAAGATAVAAGRHDRRSVWWIAAMLWTGVLWTALVWGQVGLVEAYTVPPALAAVLIGAWLTGRAAHGRTLVASGLALLVTPTLLLVLFGNQLDSRAGVSLIGAMLLIALAYWADRPQWYSTRGVLADPLAWFAGVAACAGPVRALWLVVQTPIGHEPKNAVLFVVVLCWAAAGAVVMAVAGAVLAERRPIKQIETWRSWALAPALTVFTLVSLCAIRSTWTVVWLCLIVELAAVGLTVLTVRATLARAAAGEPRRRRWAVPMLPPSWFCWLIALAWAIGGWSLRELRVEVYALPLGVGLTAAGMLALHAEKSASTRLRHSWLWPVGFDGSMATLAPGVMATLGPSLLAIWTDPMTWRAILVVCLCLVFMVEGARELLRAPLVIGAVTLGLAVLSVFGTQLGSAISAGPWLLTLMSAGGLLLVLGVYTERRKADGGTSRRTLR